MQRTPKSSALALSWHNFSWYFQSENGTDVLQPRAYDWQVATGAEELIYSSLHLDLAHPAVESNSPFLDHLPYNIRFDLTSVLDNPQKGFRNINLPNLSISRTSSCKLLYSPSLSAPKSCSDINSFDVTCTVPSTV